jgi:hypothetical protein
LSKRVLIMIFIVIRLIVFACTFGGALLGMFLRAVLPERHLSADSKETVRLGMGMIATMAAGRFGQEFLRHAEQRPDAVVCQCRLA